MRVVSASRALVFVHLIIVQQRVRTPVRSALCVVVCDSWSTGCSKKYEIHSVGSSSIKVKFGSVFAGHISSLVLPTGYYDMLANRNEVLLLRLEMKY